MQPESLAIYDLDGTCFDKTAGIELLKDHLKSNTIKKMGAFSIYSLYFLGKIGFINKEQSVDSIYKIYAQSMRGKSSQLAQTTALETWSKLDNQLFQFPKETARLLGEAGYRLVMMSGSPKEIVEHAANAIGIKHVIAGELEINNSGFFTGKVTSSFNGAQAKVDAISAFASINNFKIDWKKSIVFGNDERDIELFKLAGHPFVIKPDKYLALEALLQKWHTFDDPDKAIYEIIDAVKKSINSEKY
jgi:HAD superfamily hydrolase (TIGR01490 family)